ncbi:MAG TPA: glycosyltransferase family 39 protein [Solirubrobacteraceae bacterium]|nr:glycosyltransferase family 39 protein [Solirubrobacteraceae bacterium]
MRSLIRGRAEDPAWARVAFVGLLVATAVAYLWNLTASGDANSFYAAAVQAGTKSWKALFFGSLDSSNFITVDKPPASLWVMALSGRIFGFSSASMLVPQVLEGVLAVGLLAASVKRWFGSGAGLLAGAMLALTPVAALMFRFNNPDALLVCLLVASAYCLVRALERGSTRWMIGVGTLIGFAFLAKMMQAFLVVPGFALVYLLAAPVSVRRRVSQLLAGGVAMTVSAGWWVAIVALWPAASRPMIDGSSDNSILNLIIGYNGLGRLTGSGGGPGGGGGGGGNFSGPTGVLRLFNDLMGAQASWLLPAALLVVVAGLAWRLRAPRTDRTRAAILLWGGWLVVSGLVFSLSEGVIHTYYTVALAPAIAALVAIGAAVAWRRRDVFAARALLALGVVVTAVWSIVLLGRAPSWEPWLVPLVGVAAAVAVVALLMPARAMRRLSAATAVIALVACLAGPVAYSAQTIGTAHTGSTPSAGPAGASAGFGGGPTGGGFGRAGGSSARGPGEFAGAPGGFSGRGAGGLPGSGRTSGGPGGDVTSSALVAALKSGASGYRWAAATSGSQSAASLELATGGVPVMAIGGFNGQGGNMSLAQFQAYVKAGDIHYYIASGGGFGGGPGGGSSTSAITSWVKAHYRSETIGGETVYDLTSPLQT